MNRGGFREGREKLKYIRTRKWRRKKEEEEEEEEGVDLEE